MKTTIEDSENREIILHIEVDDQTLSKHLVTANKKVANKMNIPGFRKGKAPSSVIENFVGREYLVNEALESLVPDVVNSSIEQNDVKAFTTPRVTIVERDPIKLDATVALRPSINISDYSDLLFEDPIKKITKKQISETIQQLLESQAVWQPVKRKIIEGDLVTLDCEGESEGKNFYSIQSSEMLISYTSDTPFPGFQKEIIGMEENQDKNFSTTFPKDFSDEKLQNKVANFSVKIISIKQKEIPDLNDEFIKSLGQEDIKTIETLNSRIKLNLETKEKDDLRRILEEKTINSLLEKSEFVISPIIIENETEYIIENQKKSLEAYKLDFDQYLQRIGQTNEDFIEKAKETAENRIKRSILFDKLPEIEDINISDEELEKEIQIMLENAPKISDINHFNDQRDSIKLSMSRQAAINAIIDRSHQPKKKITKKTKSKKEKK